MKSIQIIVITQDLNKKQLKSFKHNDTSDDFLRLTSSITGKYLASISLKRQLTLYNLENEVQIQNFTEQNITHIAFSQIQNTFAVSTKIPNLRFYEISEIGAGLTTVTLIKQIQQTTQSTNSYGWLAWSLDNKYLFYVKDEDIFYVDTTNYTHSVISTEVKIKSSCSPYYIIYDRVYNQLISCSRTGKICKFKVQNKMDAKGQTIAALDFLESTNIGSNYMIAGIGQSKELIFVNTVKITTSGNTFYNSYTVSKRSLNSYSVISLRSELIAPGLMIQTDNFHSYILSFIKGEQNLYISNSLQVMNTTSSSGILNSSNPLSLKQIQKIKMPFLLHSVHYNEPSDRLIFGVTGQKNKDKLVFMDFKFDCATIANISNSTLKQSQLKNLCTKQCKSLSIDNNFSFSQAKCIEQPLHTVIQMQGCFIQSKSHQWNQYISSCELKCHKVQNSFSPISYGVPQQCLCNQGYLWYSTSSRCLTTKQIQQKETKLVQNSTSGIDNKIPLVPAKDNNPNQSTINSQQSGGSAAVIVSVLLVILLVVAGVFLTIAYKYKKWCFRRDPYVQQNELRQSDIKQKENKSQNSHQKDENQVKNDEIGAQKERQIPKKDQFHKQNQLINDIISQNYYEQQIKTDSNENDEDYQFDSERKL